MLTTAENERLTQVGPGTPMGELMRRYWHPIAAVGELDAKPTKPVRILGEDLVLYRDNSGTYGLIDRYCPHRRVDLSYGIPEEHGLRCMYHGWMFDESGACTEQPFEETVHPDGRFKEKTGVIGYPVQESAGLLFAYMGPQPAPLLPQWDQLTWDNVVRDICLTNLPCNWLQCQENSLDGVHSEWLHGYYGNWLHTGQAARPKGQGTTIKLGFDAFEYGIIKRRLQQGFSEDGDDWVVGHPVMFPNILSVGNETRSITQWRVPMDDENTLHISLYTFRPAPGTRAPQQDVPAWRYVPLTEPDGRYFTGILFNQDFMAWSTQGRVADRTIEMLGRSDVGIIMFRRMLAQQLDVVADGGEPMNVFRDPAEAARIVLPLEKVKHGVLADGKYRPMEAGPSAAHDLIEQTLATWTAVYAGKEGAQGFF